MKSPFSVLSRLGLATAIAAPLFGMALIAAPAQAASSSQFSFSLSVGNAGTYDYQHHRRYQPVCLSYDQVATGLEGQGFQNVRIGTAQAHQSVQAFGTWHHSYYSLTVNRCTGQVYNLQRVSSNTPPRYNHDQARYDSGYAHYDGGYNDGYYAPSSDYGYDYGNGYDYYPNSGGSIQFGFGY